MESSNNQQQSLVSQKRKAGKKKWVIIAVIATMGTIALFFAIVGLLYLGIKNLPPSELAKLSSQMQPASSEEKKETPGLTEENAKKAEEEDVPATQQENEQKNQAANDDSKEDELNNQPTNPVDKIPVLLKEFSNLEITVWDSKNNFAKSATPPPYEVIVNAGNGKIASCYYAKISAFEIMKILYSDKDVKDKISRVLFTSWGHLRVSVGSEDGTKTDWVFTGPTNFWKVMMKYKPFEDETGPLNQRTWGKYIDSECY